MDPNWKPFIFLAAVGVLVIGMQFGAYAIKDANAQDAGKAPEATEFVKPDDAPLPQSPRQMVCAELIKNIERAYGWDIKHGNTDTRPYLAATIQIYNGAKANVSCRKSVFSIMEGVKDGK